MTVSIQLSDEQAAALQARAAKQGLTVDAWLQRLVEHFSHLRTPSSASACDDRPIWEMILDNMKDIPPAEFEKLPADGARRTRPLPLRSSEAPSMSAVFADTFYWIAFTFYWIAFTNVQDAAHERAKALVLSAERTTIVTTEEVLIEYMNYFAGWGPNFRRKALINTRHILRNRQVKVAPHTRASFLTGLDLYGARLDKGYSLTDCISMQTMQAEGITDALTNDTHFEQEGFRALFRDS